ncbi:Nitrate reductase, gamma subunit, partial [mine drainage metagenome]
LTRVPLIYRIHMLCGMTVFLLFPFTRLVHIWTVPFNYLTRRYQIVRGRRTA